MGLDSLYMLFKHLFIISLVHVYISYNINYNFFISIVAMIVFALVLYRFLFNSDKRPIYFLLLVGIILGTFMGSITTFLQVLIDPKEFTSLQE